MGKWGDASIPPSGALSRPVGGHGDFIQGTPRGTLTPGSSDILCVWGATQESGAWSAATEPLSLLFRLFSLGGAWGLLLSLQRFSLGMPL